MAGYLYWSGYAEALTAAETSTMNAARMLEAHLDDSLRRTDGILALVARRIPDAAALQSLGSEATAATDADLSAVMGNFPETAALRVFDAAGKLIYATDRNSAPTANIGDQPYFVQLRDQAEGGRAYSEVFATGENRHRTMAVLRRLTDGSGNFLGVAQAIVDLDLFQAAFKALGLAPGSLVAIFHLGDHKAIVSWPDLPDRLEHSPRSRNAIVKALASGRRVLALPSYQTHDDVLRFVSVRVLEEYPFYVMVAYSNDQIFGDWHRRAIAVGIGGILLMGISFYLVRRVVQAENKASDAAVRMWAERDFAETLIDDTPSLIVVLDRFGQVIRFNRACREATGFDEGEVRGRPFLDTSFRPEPGEPAGLALARLLQGRSVLRYEDRLLTKNGDARLIDWKATIIRNEAGEVDYVISAGQDVTERKRAEEGQRRLLQIIEAARDLIASTDVAGRVTYLNPVGRKLLGIAEDAAELGCIGDFFPHETARWIVDEALSTAAREGFWEDETEFLTRAGQRVPVWQVIVSHTNDQGDLTHYSIIARDLTPWKRDEAELRLAASVYRNTTEGIMVTDETGTIVSVNPAFTHITGYFAEEAIGRNSRLLKSDLHDPDFYQRLWSDLLRKGHWQGQIWNRRKDGELYLEWLTITRIAGTDNQPLRYVAVFSDTTERYRHEERIRHLAYHDPLTGLPNRQLLQDRVEHAVAKAKRDGTALAVMFLDLDRFKVVNDTLGHNLGDLLLQEVATRISSCLRETDTVGRLGGDEFVILLENAPPNSAVGGVAEKVLASIAAAFDLEGQEVHVSASIGIAIFPQDGEDAIVLMKNADTAMYQAKAQGRNEFLFFDTSMNAKAMARLGLENALRRALARGEFELHYQPKVCLRTRRICGLEALARWRSAERGIVAPGEFIPVAEETGLIGPLGDWVIGETCRQIAEWRDHGLAVLPVAVNVSPAQLLKADLATRIQETCRRHDIDPGLLEIEVTEGSIMREPEAAVTALTCLRRIGVRVAVDDFGTGYSSLAYLKRLPIDVLKIDRSFVMEADRDAEDAEIVRTIVALGKSLKLLVIAEGVESESQLSILDHLGCSAAQGYLFGRPAPAAEAVAWLSADATGASCLACATRHENCLA